MDSTRLKFQKEVGMSICQRLVPLKPQEPFEGGKFWMGLHGFGGWCHGTATCSQGLASNRSRVNKMPCLLQTLTRNLSVWTWFWLQNGIFVYIRTKGRLPFFCVKFLMCPSKIALHIFVFFSHSSLWLGPVLLFLSTRIHLSFHEFLIWYHRFDWLHGACWWVVSFFALIWYDLMSCFHFGMLRLEGKSAKRCGFSNLIHYHGHLQVWLDMMFH